MKQENIDKSITAVVDDRFDIDSGKRLDDITLRFKKYWTSILFPCQKADQYGAMFLRVPSFNMTKVNPDRLCNMWTICALMASVQRILDKSCKVLRPSNIPMVWLGFGLFNQALSF